MRTSKLVFLLLAILAITFMMPTAARAATLDVDFCDCFSKVVTNALLGYLPAEFAGLITVLKPPLADINGASLIDTDPEATAAAHVPVITKEELYPRSQYPAAWIDNPVGSGTNWTLLDTVIDIHGNGMRDCGAELGIIRRAMATEALDLSATGGITHTQILNAWTSDQTTLATCVGSYWTLLGGFAPGLQEILTGYLVIGDGSFNQTGDVYTLEGGGGFIQGLLSLLGANGLLGDPSLADLTNYTRFPELLSAVGDADGDGCSNGDEYIWKGLVSLPNPVPDPMPTALKTAITNADNGYVTAALDPLQSSPACQSGEGEGEGEGEGQVVVILPDADHDALPDELEPVYGTDMNNPDSDAGGVMDGIEVALGMNPLDPADDHLLPANSYTGLVILGGFIMGAAAVATAMRLRKGRKSA
jgi:hypothetical protein